MRLLVLSIISLFFFDNINMNSQSFFDDAGGIAFSFYKNIMSPVKNDVSKCQFQPSCSEFASQAIKEYGFAKGSVLAADRLIRCSGGHAVPGHYPRIGRLYYDPPQQNFLAGNGSIWKLAAQHVSDYSLKKDDSNSNSQFGFAHFLYSDGDFDLSILELKRIQYISADSDKKKHANILLALNYFRLNKLVKARDEIDKAVGFNEPILSWNSFLLSFFIADQQRSDLWNINNSAKFIDDFSDKKDYILKLQAYSYIKDGNYIGAKASIVAANSLNSGIDTNNIFDFFEYANNISGRSPFFAGVLSMLVPGTGYMYCGNYKEGLSALLVNGLLGASIYSLFKNDNVPSGILVSAISVPFYLGNIVGSANSAKLYNNKKKEIMYFELRNKLDIEFVFSFEFFDSIW